jgi:hypothetical protein
MSIFNNKTIDLFRDYLNEFILKEKLYLYRGYPIWNDIPVEIAGAQTHAEFKSKIS